jgi:DNA polymerase-3 subunit epsilon
MTKIAVVDIETTGKTPHTGLIVEIGIVKLDLESGEINILFDKIIKEPGFGERQKKSWIFLNSDLCFNDVENASTLESQLSIVQEILNKYEITAFNKSFDIGFLKSRGFKIQREFPCIMETMTSICRIPLPWYDPNKPYKWPNAQEAWDFFFPNSDYIEKHRAADDAIHEAKILFEMIDRNLFSY